MCLCNIYRYARTHGKTKNMLVEGLFHHRQHFSEPLWTLASSLNSASSIPTRALFKGEARKMATKSN